MAVACTNANSHLYCTGVALPNTGNPFSINVWVRATWNGGARLSFVGLYDGTPATGTPTTAAGLQIGTGGGAGEVSCWRYGGLILIQSATGVMTPRNGLWTMITYVWDGTNHRLYVDGSSIATPTATAFTPAQMTQVYINGYPPTGTALECSAMAVDSYGSYRRALTAGEIITLYNNAGFRGGNVYQLACQYEFDEGVEGAAAGTGTGTAPRVTDMTGQGQDLLHTGATNTTSYTYINTYPNSNIRPVQ